MSMPQNMMALHPSASLGLQIGALDIERRDDARIVTECRNRSVDFLLFNSHRGKKRWVGLAREWAADRVADSAGIRKGTVDEVIADILLRAD